PYQLSGQTCVGAHDSRRRSLESGSTGPAFDCAGKRPVEVEIGRPPRLSDPAIGQVEFVHRDMTPGALAGTMIFKRSPMALSPAAIACGDLWKSHQAIAGSTDNRYEPRGALTGRLYERSETL